MVRQDQTRNDRLDHFAGRFQKIAVSRSLPSEIIAGRSRRQIDL
jgi:hypothetical protein